MKRKKIYLIISTAILVITAAWFINSYFNSASYFLSKLPEQYTGYKPLNTKIESAHHEIVTLFTGGRAKFIYRDTINNVLIIARTDVQYPENKNPVITTTYYRLDNKGTLLDTLKNSSGNFGSNSTEINPITVYSSETGYYNWKNPKSFIQIEYFLKQEYSGERGPAIMAPAPMTFPANWKGIGYFSLHFPNDTIHFKHPIYYFPGPKTGFLKEHYGNELWGKLDLFTVPGFKFQLLTVGFDNDNVHELDGCYLVKTR